ncbi:MAG: invasion associated locus B family protein [Xanthobacteraceae bacterium]
MKMNPFVDVRVLFTAAFAASALCVSISEMNAQAAKKPETPPANNWRVECTNDGKVLDCRAIQQVVQRDTNLVVSSITIRVPVETKKPVMLIQLPLGILVSEPMTLKVDEGQAEKITIQTCTPTGCYAGSPLPDALLTAMRSGKQLKVTFQNNNKQTVSVEMPLAGFVPAYEKIK